jgi:1-acyl-sn-glycerol-3-phosphate acyltransferase
MLAIKAKVPIIPVSIDSSYKLFSSINIKIHKPIDMSEYYTQRLDTEEYISINSKIIKDIYNELSLYKLRKNYENHSS